MSTSDTPNAPHFTATLVRGHRYDLSGRVFEAGIARPISADDRRYLERHAVIAAEVPGDGSVCMFDFAEDTRSRQAADDAFRLESAKARNARLGDYTMPATVEAARVHPLDKRKDHA